MANTTHERTEFELMLQCKSYFAGDPYIRKIANEQSAKLRDINAEHNEDRRAALLKDFFTFTGTGRVVIVPPLFCEYGFNITVGDDVFIHTGCTILDVGPVSIGSRTLIGPNVQIYTPTHPISPEERAGMNGREAAKPIKIGNDCWIGGSVVILPGVTIGDGVTVGAGSVITKDVEPRRVVAGNPARLIKLID
ncbi:hypothetical protein ONZ45_g9822 [Pleurotus djamor]|nr:hypothetical protein ONZ45_g9822 [Pleurotus djamor]